MVKPMKTTDELLLDLMSDLKSRNSRNSEMVSKKLLILSTPRSGSSLFCDVLTRTSQIGECQEWFNPRYIQAYAKLFGLTQVDFNEYTQFIIKKTIGSSGVFAVNMHIEQILQLKQSNINPLELGFDLIVYVSRRNKIKQAVSLARASLTDQWSTGTAGRETPPEIPNSLIAQSLHHILESEQIYSNDLKQIVNEEFEYEDFQNLDTTLAYKAVLGLLGKSLEGTIKTTLERQSDDISANAVTRFMDYISGSPETG